ncbi:hypothetical protein NA57DRAFT_44840 [Rhizodiscina lignyota]|uniref:Uncharacterized protein n=1 Tax=Rhizodiscina lignyota TaxID=1504668 RepID=A0A9P4I7S8_9PEZI|nr:hypothetical protein NA57DRAFT_44840 [Rhizodiscina lignyota]
MSAQDEEGGPSRPRSRAPSRPQSLHSAGAESFAASLAEHLPEKLSKIALSYRTNEWAKHLEVAEKPDVEEIAEPESPGIQNVDGDKTPPQGSVTVKGNSITVVPHSERPQTSSAAAPPLLRQGSSTTIPRPSTSSKVAMRPESSVINMGGSLSRQSSATRLATLVSPAPDTLLGKRETMMKHRVSSMSFNQFASTPNLQGLDEEDMTLAERRQLIQAHRRASGGMPPTSAPQGAQSRPQSAQQPLGSVAVPNFDSHQPKRDASSMDASKREAMLASWRASMRNEFSATSTPTGAQRPAPDEGRRATLLNERKQAEMMKAMQERQANARDAAFDTAMRRGDMLDLHKEAMRKMQGQANRNA